MSIRASSERLSDVNSGSLTKLEGTMKYLCLVYLEEKVLQQLSGPAFDALVTESLDYDDELRQRGHFIVAQALQPVQNGAIRHGTS